jgi:phosphoglycolate phosphatase
MDSMKLLIFDFDGVIADTITTVVSIINNKFSKRFNAVLTADDIRRYGARALFQKYKITGLHLLLYARQMQNELGKRMEEVPACNGIIEALGKLDGCKLALVTSNSAENARKFLEAHNIKGFGILIGGAAMFGKEGKFKKAMKMAHASKEDVLCIGDQLSDVEAAKKAGMKIAAVTWGYGSRELLETGNPDFIIENPEEILKIVQNY